MVNDIGFLNTSSSLDAMALPHLSPGLSSLFLNDRLELSLPLTPGILIEDFGDGIIHKPVEESNPYTKQNPLVVSSRKHHIDERCSHATASASPRTVEYYGFRTVKFDSTEQATFFDIKTGEIAFGSETVIEAIPLEAIAHFEQVGEPTWGLMETKELTAWHQKIVQCAGLLKNMSCRLAIGSVIVGTAAGLTSFFFPAALPVAGFFLSQSFYPALAYWAGRSIQKAVHFRKQVKFECVTKSEIYGGENIAGVKFTGTLPAAEFDFVTQQLASTSSPLPNPTELKNDAGLSLCSG